MEEKRKRRRLYRFNLGAKHERKWGTPSPVRLLEKIGFTAKIVGTILTGVSRSAADVMTEIGNDKASKETLLSIVGYTYSSLSKIELYAYPEDLELIQVIIKGCEYEILDPEELPDYMR